jgi:hypothetical protein
VAGGADGCEARTSGVVHCGRTVADSADAATGAAMKTRCSECMNWIAWSQQQGRWYHLTTGVPECRFRDSVATRSTWLPLVPFDAEDFELVRP